MSFDYWPIASKRRALERARQRYATGESPNWCDIRGSLSPDEGPVFYVARVAAEFLLSHIETYIETGEWPKPTPPANAERLFSPIEREAHIDSILHRYMEDFAVVERLHAERRLSGIISSLKKRGLVARHWTIQKLLNCGIEPDDDPTEIGA